MQEKRLSELSKIEKRVINKALETLKNSYSPYSNFKVGAAVLTSKMKIFTGTNVENASFGATICAERSAIANAISNGYKDITTIAIIADDNSDRNIIVSPCGICRQVIAEFANISNTDIKILMSDKNITKVLISSIFELLPSEFKFK